MKLSFWDILASMVMLAGLAMATIFINIFVNPYTFINPFPPPTQVGKLNVPTLTPSPRSLPQLWTDTPETPESLLSATPSATATVTGTHLVLPTATKTPTRTVTRTPTKSVTNTPNRTWTAVAYRSPTSTSASSSDTTGPTTPGKPTTSSTTDDGTPTFTWTASTDSGSGLDFYQIYINYTATCGGTYFESSSNTWTSPTLASNGNWYVCVRAVDNNSNVSSWSPLSDAFAFSDVINPTTPGTPSTLSLPTDTTPTFTWTASTDTGSGLAGYEVYWGTINACGSTTLIGSASYTPTLTINGNYYICVRARDRVGNISSFANGGVPVLFNLAASLAPSVTTNAATALTATSATLNGTVNANNANTTVTFQYGLTAAYGTSVAAVPPTVAGAANTPVSYAIPGTLLPGTTYHFRVVGVNSVGTTNGSDLTFTTSKLDQAALVAVVDHTPVVFGTTATMSTTGGSGTGAVTYNAGASTGCSISGTTLSVTNASGTCDITATKAGDATYNVVSSAALPVALAKATQTALSVVNPGPVLYGSTPTLSTAGGSGVGAVTYSHGASTGCTVSGVTLTVTDASGSCDITATKATDNNYNAISSAPLAITLQKANQATLTVDDPSPAVFGATPTLTSTGGSGTGGVTFSAGASTGCNVTAGTTLNVTDVSGTCNITATKAADTNYNVATSAPLAVTLQKAIPDITTWPTASTITYPQTLASSTLSGEVIVTPGTFAFTTPGTVPNAGTATHSVTFTPTDTTNYNTATNPVSVTVNMANQTISFTSSAPVGATVGVGSYTPTATATSSLTVTFAIDGASAGVCVIDGSNVVTFTGAGTCTINADQAGDSNYNAAPQVPQSFVVGP
jgi:large repetitive protein